MKYSTAVRVAAATALATSSFLTYAQSSGAEKMRDSMEASSYVGASLGRSNYGLSACNFGCDKEDLGLKVYGGGLFTPYFGLEAGYVRLGEASRNGGEVSGQGANVSVVGRLPIGDAFSLQGRLGGIYSWTRVTSSVGGAVTGHDSGLDFSYGAGLQYDFDKNWGMRADWDRYRLRFVTGHDDVNLYSLGVVYKFR